MKSTKRPGDDHRAHAYERSEESMADRQEKAASGGRPGRHRPHGARPIRRADRRSRVRGVEEVL